MQRSTDASEAPPFDAMKPASYHSLASLQKSIHAAAVSLSRCEGYLELKMWDEAWEELAQLPPALREQLPVLACQIQVLVGLKEYEKAAQTGLSLIHRFPDHLGVLLMTVDFFIAMNEHAAARSLIAKHLVRFAGQPEVWKSLADIEASLGNLTAAERCLKRHEALSPPKKATMRTDAHADMPPHPHPRFARPDIPFWRDVPPSLFPEE